MDHVNDLVFWAYSRLNTVRLTAKSRVIMVVWYCVPRELVSTYDFKQYVYIRGLY